MQRKSAGSREPVAKEQKCLSQFSSVSLQESVTFVVIITQPAEFLQARKEKKILIYSMIKGRFLYELYLDRS